MAATEHAPGLVIQGFQAPLRRADFRVIAFDMDSTLINIECIDEIADACGKKAEVAAITEASMRGEIADFAEGLRRRVALLAGTPETFLAEVFEQRLRLNPGAEALMDAAREAGWHTLLVSGGFTYFADRVRQQLRMDEAHANVLEVVDGHLSGQVLGAIVDGAAKQRHLLSACARLGCPPSAAIAVGDGANDLAMMAAAGLSVGFHAKPVVRRQAGVAINDGGLDRLLEVFAG